MGLNVEKYTYDWRPDYPLVVTAKRYWDPSNTRLDGYTCVYAHATGFHKETWEPVIDRLFAMSKASLGFPIREAWSVDCPNHGEAAVINEAVLIRGCYDFVYPWGDYAHALYLFLTENREVWFNDRKVIAIGHSMGAVSLCLTQTYPRPPRFAQIVLCEPMLAPTELRRDDPLLAIPQNFATMTERRKDVWTSLEDASRILNSRKVVTSWDEDILRLYLEYGFRDLPTLLFPDRQGVTLTCPKNQEAACYRDSISARRIYEFLPELCRRLPVHVIWGAIDDSLLRPVKDLATKPAQLASLSRVEGAGHLIVQMAPKGVAEAIFAAVTRTTNLPGKL